MAWENTGPTISLPASTGLKQFRFVTVNSAGNIAYPSLGAPIAGVLVSSGTTGSTSDRYGTVQVAGVAKIAVASASTVSAGDSVAASSHGSAVAHSAGNYDVGIVVDGSSGGANRVLSVLISPIGTT